MEMDYGSLQEKRAFLGRERNGLQRIVDAMLHIAGSEVNAAKYNIGSVWQYWPQKQQRRQ